jgi:hypothetical protein
LSFQGFTAGDSLARVDRQVHLAGGSALSCRTSQRDSTLQECRARLPATETRQQVEVWLAAMDGASGILTLSGRAGSGTLRRWRDSLVAQYGAVPVRTQGKQSMMQWVRRGRMLRLTWRRESGDTLASVSLVDGHILDAWGARRRESRVAPSPSRP